MRINAFRYLWLAVTISLAAFLAVEQAAGSDSSTSRPNAIHQLRIYELFDNSKKTFHERFRDHAMRIMARYDFNILAMWETKNDGRTEFVYLLEWPDEATMKDRWSKFMADQEWSDIKRRTRGHGPLVGEIEDRALILTNYSPSGHVIDPAL